MHTVCLILQHMTYYIRTISEINTEQTYAGNVKQMQRHRNMFWRMPRYSHRRGDTKVAKDDIFTDNTDKLRQAADKIVKKSYRY